MAKTGRSYEKTHPHISFTLDLKHALAPLWILLGESKSKSQHVAKSLLSPGRSHELMVVYLTKGALATTAIEGNTLSEIEAREVVEQTSKLPPSKQYLGREIDNVIEAYNQIKDELMNDQSIRVSPERLNHYNAMILKIWRSRSMSLQARFGPRQSWSGMSTRHPRQTTAATSWAASAIG